jgi:hypothetical protein
LRVRFASLKEPSSGAGALALEWREDDQQKVRLTTKYCRSIEEKCAPASPQ